MLLINYTVIERKWNLKSIQQYIENNLLRPYATTLREQFVWAYHNSPYLFLSVEVLNIYILSVYYTEA